MNRKVDFRVEDELGTVGDTTAGDGWLYVVGKVDADYYDEHSTFYDKDTYGSALDYVKDSSKTVMAKSAEKGARGSGLGGVKGI